MTKSEKEIENSYYLGQSVGLDECAGFLKKKAAEFFLRPKTSHFGMSNDEVASMLRDLSEQVQKTADARYTHADHFAKPEREGRAERDSKKLEQV